MFTFPVSLKISFWFNGNAVFYGLLLVYTPVFLSVHFSNIVFEGKLAKNKVVNLFQNLLLDFIKVIMSNNGLFLEMYLPFFFVDEIIVALFVQTLIKGILQ